MGILRNEFFWAGLLNAIESIDRRFESVEAQSELISNIGCRAFTTLLDDPEFDDDLKSIFSLSDENLPSLSAVAFERFLEIEGAILNEAGASSSVTRDLQNLILSLRGAEVEAVSVSDFRKQATVLKETFCAGHDSLLNFEVMPGGPKRRSRWAVTKKTIGGVLTMSANAGSVTAASIAFPVTAGVVGLAAAYSVEYGRKMWMDAWNGRW